MLLVDVDSLATDTRFPDDAGTAKVAALLLLDTMDGPTTVEQLRLTADRLLDKFPRWAKSHRGEDGTDALVADALAVLASFGLVRVVSGVVTPLPAAARYAVRGTRISGPDDTAEEMEISADTEVSA